MSLKSASSVLPSGPSVGAGKSIPTFRGMPIPQVLAITPYPKQPRIYGALGPKTGPTDT